ncbi:hypothetical protein OIU84_000599, partial [Salix udensis]
MSILVALAKVIPVHDWRK